MARDAMPRDLPKVEHGAVIPKIIHQTFKNRDLPPEFQSNIDQLKAVNPGWDYRFYDDSDTMQFISTFYGPHILAYYERINPKYGAARADLFRYLLLYKYGGVYLDIKSTFTKPIDDVLQPDDQYLLAGWSNGLGEAHQDFGMSKELRMIPGGEFQQWHIISVPGHPFLRAVIETVLNNIDHYKPWLHGTGANGVWRLTGPIAYTLAIHPLLPLHPHRAVRTDAELSLLYNMLKTSHKSLFASHYEPLTESVIKMDGIEKVMGHLYSFARKTKRKVYWDIFRPSGITYS